MNFCPEPCETYLQTQITTDENANKIMSFVCNNCNYKKSIDISKEPEYKCVYQYNYNLKKNNINKQNLKFFKKDPTLPHVNNIPCPNVECITNKENINSEVLNINSESENINDVLYIKLNESDLTYQYQCCNCNHTWTNK